MTKPRIVKTDDGSDTLYHTEVGEHYHSKFGAVQESMHIFINGGLKKCDKPEINLFEAGFGTGLNAFLTLAELSESNQKIRYITVEKNPLSAEVWSALNYPAIIPNGNAMIYRQIHLAEWNKEIKITDFFSILKLDSDLLEVDYAKLPLFDLVYFDSFSPEKQPELWETHLFRQISNHCNVGAILMTYCAKGAVRRSLNEAGFSTERIPGPPGKREILRGTKL